ncbi:unnamed protein product, partial [marine sediment metagenome]
LVKLKVKIWLFSSISDRLFINSTKIKSEYLSLNSSGHTKL